MANPIDQHDDPTVGGKAPLTDRVNVEPPILNGMTVTEAQVIGGVSMVVFLLVGALVFAVTGYWQAILVLGMFGTGGTLWFASQYLAGIKRDRPDGYYTQRMWMWMSDRGLIKSKLITHSGYWELGRSLDLHLSADLEGELPEAIAPSAPSATAPADEPANDPLPASGLPTPHPTAKSSSSASSATSRSPLQPSTQWVTT